MKTSGFRKVLLGGLQAALVLALVPGCSDSDSDGDSGGQALNVAGVIDADPAEAVVLLVTSPDHMKRALGAFRKVGFERIAGSASFSEAIEMNLLYDPEELGGRKVPLPDGAGTLMVRYQFWNNLGYLGAVAREWTALTYYWAKGWI